MKLPKMTINKLTGETGFWIRKKGQSVFYSMAKFLGEGLSMAKESGLQEQFLLPYSVRYKYVNKLLKEVNLRSPEGPGKMRQIISDLYRKKNSDSPLQRAITNWVITGSANTGPENASATLLKYLDNSVRGESTTIRMSADAFKKLNQEATTGNVLGLQGLMSKSNIYKLQHQYVKEMADAHAILKKVSKDGKTIAVFRGVEGRTAKTLNAEADRLKSLPAASNKIPPTMQFIEDPVVSTSLRREIGEESFGAKNGGFSYARKVPITQTSFLPGIDTSAESAISGGSIFGEEMEVAVRGGKLTVPLQNVTTAKEYGMISEAVQKRIDAGQEIAALKARLAELAKAHNAAEAGGTAPLKVQIDAAEAKIKTLEEMLANLKKDTDHWKLTPRVDLAVKKFKNEIGLIVG